FHVVIRGDVHWIRIGEQTNVQDGSVLHVTNGKFPLSIGARVTIGHKVLLHGCTVGNDCLIGMGAILLDGVEVGDGSVVA
ncbi:gamma carbonic anhydrase family protein, partial [Pseudomonas sp. FW305-122]